MGILPGIGGLLSVLGAGLTPKGYGHVYGASDTASLSLSYGNVDSGSAPVDGDLVVWMVLAQDASSSPVVNRTGSGWAQSFGGGTGANDSGRWATILAKVVESSDISSPETIVTGPQAGSIGFWVAYTVAGTIATLSISSVSTRFGGLSAPPNQTADSSALNPPDVGIAIGAGTGNDNAPTLSISGGTADIAFVSANNVWETATAETRFVVNSTVGGASITFSKDDDGNNNHMASGYVSVSFS